MLSQASFARSQALLGVIERSSYLIDPDFHFERGTHVHGKQLLVGIDDAVLKIYVIGEDDEMIIREARNEIIREAFPERLRHMEQEGITGIKAEVDIV